MDSSHPINVQMLVDYAELKMQEKRDLSLRFFLPFVFWHRKISTDSPTTPPHPTCLVLGMPGAIRMGQVAASSPTDTAWDEPSSFPTCWISAARNLLWTHIAGSFFRYLLCAG